MLHYALVFLVIAVIAGVLCFGGIAGAFVGIAKILFLVFYCPVRCLAAAGQASRL